MFFLLFLFWKTQKISSHRSKCTAFVVFWMFALPWLPRYVCCLFSITQRIFKLCFLFFNFSFSHTCLTKTLLINTVASLDSTDSVPIDIGRPRWMHLWLTIGHQRALQSPHSSDEDNSTRHQANRKGGHHRTQQHHSNKDRKHSIEDDEHGHLNYQVGDILQERCTYFRLSCFELK